MENYLGEIVVDQKDTKFKDFDTTAWVMYFLECYSQYDGGHHKAWVLDQIARIIKGTPVIIKLAKWGNGKSEYRVSLGEASEEYNNWVVDMCDGEDGSDTYDYDIGIAP